MQINISIRIHVEHKIIIIDLSVNVMPTMLCTRNSFAEKATAFTFILSPVIACLARCCLQRCVWQRLWWKAMSVRRLMRRILEPINPKESKTNQGVSHVVLLKEDVTHHALTHVVANFLNQPSATAILQCRHIQFLGNTCTGQLCVLVNQPKFPRALHFKRASYPHLRHQLWKMLWTLHLTANIL